MYGSGLSSFPPARFGSMPEQNSPDKGGSLRILSKQSSKLGSGVQQVTRASHNEGASTIRIREQIYLGLILRYLI